MASFTDRPGFSLDRPLAPSAPSRIRATDAPAFVTYLLGFYFVLEYVRPQGLAQLHLQLLITLILPLFWIASASRPWTPANSAQVVFVALCAGGAVMASNNYAAYISTRGAFANLSVCVAMYWTMGSRRDFERLVWFWVAIMVYVAGFSLSHAGRGPGGLLGDENDLALGLCTALPFAIYGMHRLRGVLRVVCALCSVLFVVGIANSYSRGGFVGLAGVMMYFLLSRGHRLRKVAMLGVAVALFLLLAPARYIDEIRSINDTQEATAQARLFLWTAALSMWKANPIFGVGANNSIFRTGEYQPRAGDWPQEYFERDWSGTTAHSVYLQMLADVGLAGIGVLGFLVYSHFTIIRRLRRDLADGVLKLPPRTAERLELYAGALGAAMAGYLVAGAFLSVGYYPYLWYFATIAAALDHWARRPAEEASGEPGHEPRRA
jgi:O-antigen ligase